MNARLDQPRPVRDGEELDVASLQNYLLAQIPDAEGPLVIEQFPSGFSNLTYCLRLGSSELVLRRPPFGNQVKSAHDMGREYRVLSALCDVYPPAPRPLHHCTNTDIIGDEFYVMQRRHGVILRGPQGIKPLQDDPQLVRRLCESFIDNLRQLHALDYEKAGLGDLGRPEGYIARQVSGWTKRYVNARTDDWPEVEKLAQWLDANQPIDRPAALIHNDFKYDNLMLDPEDLTHVVALLDWEMATLGDPWMDLGTSLAYWIEPTDSEPQRQRAFGPTMLRGSMTRRELVQRYAIATGDDPPDPLFYYCFGLFKLAVIVQQIYARFRRGATADPRFKDLDQVVAALGNAGIEAIEKRDI